ncbi:hypothetical protein NK8_74690 (plasmid) [Caballeronia sp. NK8]|uniref:hypothetical protein n=1 Tax=Caballeronia sp. NK8 TaxID=140098 RepID=UPI001BB66A75|nr:hypothetical protein [Caballeronia sp. NK8]BCQ29279.1 hypothetical protein NK8_74690 [Caballeronia sp. NK8]
MLRRHPLAAGLTSVTLAIAEGSLRTCVRQRRSVDRDLDSFRSHENDLFTEIAAAGLALHEAYTVYGASRVSRAYCIMSSLDDLRAAASCADNHDVYREMVRLEAESTFAFQGQRWLADVAPHLLAPELTADVARAKAAAIDRQAIEAEIPAHLLFSSGWPTVRPTRDEAELLASVRRRVAHAVGIEIGYTSATDVMRRYDELLAQRSFAPAAEIPAQASFAF